MWAKPFGFYSHLGDKECFSLETMELRNTISQLFLKKKKKLSVHFQAIIMRDGASVLQEKGH